MLQRIIDRIKRHKKSLIEFQEGKINEEEYEKRLLNEISFFQQDFEEKISLEILEQEEKLSFILLKIKDIALKKNIDKETLKNIILSEINRAMIDEHLF
ncbi:hypothetical protein [Aquimarina algiphila]|uniref:hypothetical protein n=1 Tax=Aquimarina algiphila TaxID=2047982 RepID=UPI00232B3F24|nr:hypothetical protein [Aquimarina algiphila]